MCNYCGRKGHLQRVCNQKKKDTYQKNGKTRGFGNRVQLVDQKEFDEEDEDIYMVLNVEGGSNEAKPFYLEGFFNGNRFKTMIDTGSPVTIFALDEIQTIMKREKLPVRQMIEGERYVDFNEKPLELLRCLLWIASESQLHQKGENPNSPKRTEVNNWQRMANNSAIQAGTAKGLVRNKI